MALITSLTAWLVGLAIVTITLVAAAPKPAVPTDRIRAILDAFRSHRVVALGEGDFWFGGPADPPHIRPAEQDFDALLYFGPPSSIALAPYGEALCGDPGYLATRLSRIQFRESEQVAAEVKRACEQQRAK